jgi:hypothetical protein
MVKKLETRDGFGIWNVPQIKTNTEAEMLMEVPMQ